MQISFVFSYVLQVHMIRLLKGAGLSGDVTLEVDASGRRNTGARLVLILDAGDAIVNWVVRSAPGSGRDGQSLGEPHIVVSLLINIYYSISLCRRILTDWLVTTFQCTGDGEFRAEPSGL